MSRSEHEGTERVLVADARRAAINDMLRAAGSVSVAEIEAAFGISSMTARRDLAELERRGQARRTHGGAVLPSISGHEDSFASRLDRELGAEQAIAQQAAELVGEGESVFLDGSSSAFHVARALLERSIPVTVITNSLPVMDLVGQQAAPSVELVGVGGMLRRLTQSFVGPVATHTVQAHVADRLFFSCKGVSRDGLLTDADALEAELKRTMIERAGDVALLLDASKVTARGLNVIARLADVHTVLAHGLQDEEASAFAAAGPRVVRIRAEVA